MHWYLHPPPQSTPSPYSHPGSRLLFKVGPSLPPGEGGCPQTPWVPPKGKFSFLDPYFWVPRDTPPPRGTPDPRWVGVGRTPRPPWVLKRSLIQTSRSPLIAPDPPHSSHPHAGTASPQVEMVDWFVDNVRSGHSRVQQMIMGAGKTTVLVPNPPTSSIPNYDALSRCLILIHNSDAKLILIFMPIFDALLFHV